MIMSAKTTITFQNNGSEFDALYKSDNVFDTFKKRRYDGSELKRIFGGSEIYRKIVDSKIYTIHSISVQGELK